MDTKKQIEMLLTEAHRRVINIHTEAQCVFLCSTDIALECKKVIRYELNLLQSLLFEIEKLEGKAK